MVNRTLRFSLVSGKFAVCRLLPGTQVPDWAWTSPFSSVTRTLEELSIVCALESVPANLRAATGWACLKIEGPFSFSEVGVLASFIAPLAAKGIGIFAISTFDTDYVLVEEVHAENAMQTLLEAGHELSGKS
jgi:hypothetical protein